MDSALEPNSLGGQLANWVGKKGSSRYNARATGSILSKQRNDEDEVPWSE